MAHHTLQCFTSLLLGGLLVAGCASDPQASREVLDARTGTTLTRMDKPVELLSEEVRGAAVDPFAYFGPFQTNRMGSYALYLWVAVPTPDNAAPAMPELHCDAQSLDLRPLDGSLEDVGLSAPPYSPPAPWSHISYYILTEAGLECLQHAAQATLTLDAGKPTEEHFLATRESLSGLARFATDAANGATPAPR